MIGAALRATRTAIPAATAAPMSRYQGSSRRPSATGARIARDRGCGSDRVARARGGPRPGGTGRAGRCFAAASAASSRWRCALGRPDRQCSATSARGAAAGPAGAASTHPPAPSGRAPGGRDARRRARSSVPAEGQSRPAARLAAAAPPRPPAAATRSAAGAGSAGGTGSTATTAGPSSATAGTGVGSGDGAGSGTVAAGRAGSSRTGSTYPFGSAATRMPRWTCGAVVTASSLAPTWPTTAPSATELPRATATEPSWSSVTA